MGLEKRDFKLDIKTVKENGEFEGYASVFGNVDFYDEIVLKGAFKKTLKEKETFPLLWYHDPKDVLGMVEAEEDNKGLRVKGQLNLGVQSAKEKYALLKQKALKGLSIGFKTIKDKIEDDIRYLLEISLKEVSLGTFPANELAFVDRVKAGSLEFKPYPNEHSARLQDPNKFDEFKRKADGKLYNKIKVPSTVNVLWGHLKGKDADAWAAQGLRFPVKNWTESEAKAWLKENEIKYIKFEPAKKSLSALITDIQEMIEIKEGRLISAEEYQLMNDVQSELKALLEANEPVNEATHVEEKPLTDDKPSDKGYLLSELKEFHHSLNKKLYGGKN